MKLKEEREKNFNFERIFEDEKKNYDVGRLVLLGFLF
jgi:hypothetical protein